MAKAKWCGGEIYELAESFRRRCLVDDDSLLTPGSPVWTPDNVRSVSDRVSVVDMGSGSFIEKLEAQLSGLAPEAIQVGAELLTMLLVPELDTGAAKKREHLTRILGEMPEEIAIPPAVEAAFHGGGVANFAAGKAHRDGYMRFVARLYLHLKSLPRAEREALTLDPWAFRAVVMEIRQGAGAMANAVLHLHFPDDFEYMISDNHRQRLIRTFADSPGVAEAENTDRKIGRIRELATRPGGLDVDLYEDPFHGVWNNAPSAAWAGVVRWCAKLYEHQEFDRLERTYKLDVAMKVRAAKDALLAGDAEWPTILRAAFADKANNMVSWRARAVFLDWLKNSSADAGRLLTALWGSGDSVTRLHGFLEDLPPEAAPGRGARVSFASFLMLGESPETFPVYRATAQSDLEKLLGVATSSSIKVGPEDVHQPEDLAARLGLDARRVRRFLRDTFPRDESGEGTRWYLSPEQAQAVLDHFGADIDTTTGAATYARWISTLEELRLRLLAAGVVLRDLLDAQGLVWWLLRNPPPSEWSAADRAAYEAFRGSGPRVTPTVEDTGGSEPSGEVLGGEALPPVSDGLATELHLPKDWLQRVLDLLADKKQAILYGPPGTGKTYVAKALARHVVSAGGFSRLVQFHPSYTYEDFFEGYRPLVDRETGSLQFQLVPGALREIAAAARNAPESPHVLIVDEINRGNIAKIFGELYFLLEYRDEALRLQYSSDKEFSLPPNLFVIGTMNTADRSIALVDAALRRRFHFVGLVPTKPPVNRVLGSWLAQHGLDTESAVLLDELNRAIADEDFSIGPSYFMGKIARDPDLERIWEHGVMPLLEERYYGTNRDLEAEFGLDAMRRRVAAAADVGTTAPDDDDSR